MTLNDLIYERISSSDIASDLTKYMESPAIFYQQAPADTESGWSSSSYPRIEFVADMIGDPERKSSGSLFCNIFCAETDVPPENLEPKLRRALSDVFIQPEKEPPYALGWAQSEAFVGRVTEQGKRVFGISMRFDLFGFPKQTTSDPDPVQALQIWMKAAIKGTVIELDQLNDYTEIGDETPIFYCHLNRMALGHCTWSVSWIDAVLSVHVFAASSEARLAWIKHLTDQLMENPEITMMDGSPMRITKIQADSSFDPIRQGQITLSVKYGILRQKNQHAKPAGPPELTILSAHA